MRHFVQGSVNGDIKLNNAKCLREMIKLRTAKWIQQDVSNTLGQSYSIKECQNIRHLQT